MIHFKMLLIFKNKIYLWINKMKQIMKIIQIYIQIKITYKIQMKMYNKILFRSKKIHKIYKIMKDSNYNQKKIIVEEYMLLLICSL